MGNTTRRLGSAFMIAALLMIMIAATPALCQLLIDDPLQGSTTGTRSGGSFVSGGWQVAADWDYIFWHLPYPVANGAAEFYVTGLHPSWSHKTELFHMYDFTYGNADYVYSGGYRDSPCKHFIRKAGVDYKNNTCELLWQIMPNYTEPDTAALSWSTSANYLMRVEWTQEGSNSRFKVFRDGGLLYEEAIAGTWNPGGQSIRIAASNRHAGEDAEVGAKYSYLKVWNLAGAVPGAPSVSMPTNGETVKGPLSFIQWTGDTHTKYQVRICSANNPDTGIVWDSGETDSPRSWAWTGSLYNGTYYIFVKLGNSNGWSAWSATGRTFIVNSGFAASNNTRVLGQSICDANGPMLGLGVTNMSAMRRCKYDRNRYNSDLAFLSARGFKYQRILSMVGWWEAWAGQEVAPVSFYNHVGTYVPAWSDYWQQLKDCIDIAYDTYGMRSEITIFADAQLIPGSAARQAHLDNLLTNLVGREHKVMHLEVANEYWQNGFPDPGGVEEVRSWGQYLSDRTSIPVALSAPCSSDNGPLANMYAGSPVDIATEHFSRDIGTFEGGWLPVRDTWRIGDLYPGVAPGSSNEPIGPGSSVAQETDVTRLVSAASFAYIAGLPMYVYHTDAGVFGWTNFEDKQGVSNFQYLEDILPPDVASWVRNDGKQSTAPFTAYCNGAANTYWTDNQAGSDGCHRNIGGRKGIEFVCYPMGIRSSGLTLQARQQVTFKVWNPVTGALVLDTTTKNAGENLVLSGSAGAYIIKGAYGPTIPNGGGGSKTLYSKGQKTITIDGATSDWTLTDFTTKIRGGQSGEGDTGIVGFEGGTCYYGSYAGVLPTSATDHAAKIYSRNDSTYLYFLIRCDDSDMRYSNPASANWANDCVEFYIDPSHDHGGSPISNSTSDIQLVIDANNQKGVYMTTAGYATQVLAGVTSAVVRDGTGWWLEARITKSALDPDVPASGNTFGLDFNFRDNDNNNDAALTTVYTWNDASGTGFPSKIPGNWGDMFLDATQAPYPGPNPAAVPGTIQAENYDSGGQSISFYDTTAGNYMGQYRSDNVDVETCGDTGGGYNIGYTAAGEWMEYTINVASTGDYSIGARVATGNATANFKILIDGSDVTGTKSFLNTGAWQAYTTIISPARYLTAGQHVLRFVTDSGGLNLNYIQIDSNGPDAVSVDLGATDIQDGMVHIQQPDGDTIAWTNAGHYCRENLDAGDMYMYFGVADIWAYQGSKANIAVTFDYYDIGTGTLGIDYDSNSSSYQHVNGPTLTNTLTWKSYTFQLTNCYFGNRENGGADFRLTGGAWEWGIDTVCVYNGSADVTPPGNVTAFTATAVATGGQINLSWTNPTDGDFTGTMIRFKTGTYPTSVTDGTSIYDSNGTSTSHTGLTNGVAYFYKAFAHDNIPNYASGAQATATPADTTPPSNVTGFTVTAGDTQNSLSWTNPGSDFTGTKIMFKTTGYPTSATDGTQVYDGSGTSTNHTGLTNGVLYYYKAFAHDGVPNHASGAQGSATPLAAYSAQYISDTIPTSMTVNQQYSVSVTMKNTGSNTWTYANSYRLGAVGDSDPFYGAGRVDLAGGDSIATNQQKTFTFTMTAPASAGTYTSDWRMLREGVLWFGDTLTKVINVSGSGTVTLNNSTFNSDADGWTLTVWRAATQYGYGTMAWNSGAGRTGGGLRCIGTGATDNSDKCNREGGEAQKTISTAGYSNIKVYYDLKVNTLGNNYTGSGTGSCVIDHSIIDEQITAFYSTNGGSSWTEAEYLTRSTLLGSYQSYGTRMIDLSGVSAVNNNANFKLRFRWQNNTGADTCDLDNLVVTSN